MIQEETRPPSLYPNQSQDELLKPTNEGPSDFQKHGLQNGVAKWACCVTGQNWFKVKINDI